MASETSIGCLQCHRELWIGKGDFVFINEPKMMQALNDFLLTHRGHVLIYDSDESPVFGYLDHAKGKVCEFELEEIPESNK